MIILGLTGSMGMGKSAVNKMFQRMGIPTHDSDATVHELYNDYAFTLKLGNAFREAFPGDVIAYVRPTRPYRPVIDRKRLGEIVYSNPEKLKLLESIVHPAVKAKQKEFLARCKRQGKPLVVLDVPLLFEAKTDKRCDYTAVVSCPDFLQEVRVLKRPGYTKQRLMDVRAKQMPNKVKIRKGDFLIPTGCSMALTFRAVRGIVTKLRGKKGTAYPKQW